jgi:hypothetical protein
MYVGRSWIGIGVFCVSTRTNPSKSWQSLASEQASLAIILEQHGGIAEARKRHNAPTPRVRYDAGHTMYIPPNADIWAFGDSTNLVRGVRMRFDLSVIDGLLRDECDRQKLNEPVLLLYDDQEFGSTMWAPMELDPQKNGHIGRISVFRITTAFSRYFWRAGSGLVIAGEIISPWQRS